MNTHPKNEIPTLLKRQVQAEVLGPVFAEMVAEIGEEAACRILDAAIRKAAIAEGKRFAANSASGKPAIADFVKIFELWTRDGALEIEVLKQTDTAFDFDVKRCRYAETYHSMGLGHIGHLLSCNRDGSFCEGFDPQLKLTRNDTIMAGAPRCTFRYVRAVGEKA